MLYVYPSIKLLSSEALAKFTELGHGGAKVYIQVSSSDAETCACDRVFFPLSSLLYSWVDNICPSGLGVHG